MSRSVAAACRAAASSRSTGPSRRARPRSRSTRSPRPSAPARVLGIESVLRVDLEDLLVSQPDCGEQALEIADTLVRTGAIDLIVVDSVAALTPRAEIDGDMGDSHM